MRTPNRHRGQVLVVFAGGLIALIAIGALVIDIGFAFMTRRMEQNVADPAAIAAARLIPAVNAGMATVDGDMRRSACAIARQNGLFRNASDDGGCTDANDPDGTRLRVYFPPTANAGTFAGRPGFVEVVIDRVNATILARALGINTIGVASSAVAAFSDGDSNNNSLIALDPRGCSGANSAGNITGNNTRVTIEPAIDPGTGLPYPGGYVHVNSTCGNPANINTTCGVAEGQSALTVNSNGATLDAPRVYVSGTCTKTNNNDFDSPLIEGAVQIGDPLADLPPPQIGSHPAGRCGPSEPLLEPTGPNSKGCNFPTGTTVLEPGVYYGGWNISNNVSLELRPGIYIIAGGGITLSGTTGSLEAVTGDATVEARVMIFSTDNPASTCGSQDNFQAQGDLSFSANSTFHAKAMDSGPYEGILLWQDGDGCRPDEPISLGGNGDVIIAGTIYAPKASVTLNGGATGTGVASVQIIANQWTLSGGASLTMPYDPEELYQFPQKGLVR
jgi:hypothetical protein